MSQLTVQHVWPIPNAKHPQILYWFLTPESWYEQQYLKDVELIARNTPFDLVFVTRQGPGAGDFWDFEVMHPVFARLVERAHELGLKIGLQLFPRPNLPIGVDEAAALAVETECRLDDRGRAVVTAHGCGALNKSPFASDLLGVWLFRPAQEGFYEPDSLVDATGSYARVVQTTSQTVTVSIEAPADLAGCTAYVLTAHYYQYGDLFGDYLIRGYGQAIEAYRDIPFDGTALDEFGYFYLPAPWDRSADAPPVRQRFYGKAMAQFYRERTGQPMAQGLFDMRYAPLGQPEVRMRAINRYFDVHRQGPLRIERFFRDKSREVFGQHIFSGVHNTAHNSLTNDEIWRTGCAWWDLPRDYGQTDEDIIYPVRLGVACSCPKDVHYDMYYDRHYNRFYPKAVRDARYGGRIHYLAFYTGQIGADIRIGDFRDHVGMIEQKVRLLNHFDGPLPEMELLTVFGYHALANWCPDEASRNTYDINGSLFIMEKAQQVWEAGYLCALAPSTAVDDGQITVTPDGRCSYNGRTFKALLMLYPQYSKAATIDFLERFAAAGGKLMIEGPATRDFDGNDISQRMAKLSAAATVNGFSLAGLQKLGIRKNEVENGCRLADGSVVMTEMNSIFSGQPLDFSVDLDGDRYQGRYVGVLAIKASRKEGLLKLACGQLSQLCRNGRVIVSLRQPADFLATRAEDGRWTVLVGGQAESNALEVFEPC